MRDRSQRTPEEIHRAHRRVVVWEIFSLFLGAAVIWTTLEETAHIATVVIGVVIFADSVINTILWLDTL